MQAIVLCKGGMDEVLSHLIWERNHVFVSGGGERGGAVSGGKALHLLCTVHQKGAGCLRTGFGTWRVLCAQMPWGWCTLYSSGLPAETGKPVARTDTVAAGRSSVHAPSDGLAATISGRCVLERT